MSPSPSWLAPVALAVLCHGAIHAVDSIPTEGSGFGSLDFADPWTETTFAGVPQDPATLDAGGLPIARDADGFPVYVADGDEGPASAARLGSPSGLLVGPDGSVYFCETQLCAVRRITPDGIIHRFAGRYGETADYTHPESVGDGGAALDARFNLPVALAMDHAGNIYVADFGRIRRIGTDGTISTIAGDRPAPDIYEISTAGLARGLGEFNFTGPATAAVLSGGKGFRGMSIHAIAVTADGSIAILSDMGVRLVKDGLIRPLLPPGGMWFGSDEPELAYGQYEIRRIAVDNAGLLYAAGCVAGKVGSAKSTAIMRIEADGTVHTVLGGSDDKVSFWDPTHGYGPIRPGFNPGFGRIAFDADNRMWLGGGDEGNSYLAHLDADQVIRFSGYTHTEVWPLEDTQVEDSPSTLSPGLDGIPRDFCRTPDGSWLFLQEKLQHEWRLGLPSKIMRIEHRAPLHHPDLIATTPVIDVSTPYGGADFFVEVGIQNVGDMYARWPMASSDQSWIMPLTYLNDHPASILVGAGETWRFKCYIMTQKLYGSGVHTANITFLNTDTQQRIVVPVRVTVEPPVGAAPNLPPNVTGQRTPPYFVQEDGVLRIDLATQVADDGLPFGRLDFSLLEVPAIGTTTLEGSVVTYTPDPDFNQNTLEDYVQMPQTLRWQVSDGEFSTWLGGSIYVLGVNDPPRVSAGGDQEITDRSTASLSGAASDVDRTYDAIRYVPQPVQLRWSKSAGPGQVLFADDRAAHTDATFSMPGTYTLRLTADDSYAAVSDEMQVTIAANSAPVAADQDLTTTEDTALLVTVTAADAEGDHLVWRVAGSPAHGTLTRMPPVTAYEPAPTFEYLPDHGFVGTDLWTVIANDGHADSNPGTIRITVTPAGNHAPVADAMSVSTDRDHTVGFSLAGDDRDGDPLAFRILTSPAHGTLAGSPPSIQYTPQAGFTGDDRFTYLANDGSVDSAAAEVAISVSEPADGGSGKGCGTGSGAAALIVAFGLLTRFRSNRRLG